MVVFEQKLGSRQKERNKVSCQAKRLLAQPAPRTRAWTLALLSLLQSNNALHLSFLFISVVLFRGSSCTKRVLMIVQWCVAGLDACTLHVATSLKVLCDSSGASIVPSLDEMSVAVPLPHLHTIDPHQVTAIWHSLSGLWLTGLPQSMHIDRSS